MKLNKLFKKSEKPFYFSLGVCLLFFVWFLISFIVKNNLVFPGIKETFKSLGDILSSKRAYRAIGFSFLRLIGVLTVSFIISFLLSLLCLIFEKLYYLLKPFVTVFRTVPIISIILILLIFKGSELTVYYTSFLVCFPLMFEAFYEGFKNIGNNYLDDIRTCSKITPYVFFKIHVPLSFSYVKVSLIQSFGLGFKAVVMSEFIASTKVSIGFEIAFSKLVFSQSEIFAWSLIMVVIVVTLDLLINLIVEKILKKSYFDLAK